MASLAAERTRARRGGWPIVRVGALPGWLIVFAVTALPYIALGWYLTTIVAVFDGDAVSRTAQAAYVVIGRDPHLAAIGFIWNPLPSLVQIPLVALLYPFGQVLLAGPIQSALCMAAAAALLWQFMGDYRIGLAARVAFVILFAANPMIVLYAANGMSEAMFILFLVGMVRAFARWASDSQPLSLVWGALMTAGAFGVRYEALQAAAAGAASVLLVLLTTGTQRWAKIEATLLVFLTPFCYAVALWIFFKLADRRRPVLFPVERLQQQRADGAFHQHSQLSLRRCRCADPLVGLRGDTVRRHLPGLCARGARHIRASVRATRLGDPRTAGDLPCRSGLPRLCHLQRCVVGLAALLYVQHSGGVPASDAADRRDEAAGCAPHARMVPRHCFSGLVGLWLWSDARPRLRATGAVFPRSPD